MIYSTVNHQKLPFSDPTHLFDDVILEWSLSLRSVLYKIGGVHVKMPDEQGRWSSTYLGKLVLFKKNLARRIFQIIMKAGLEEAIL